MDDRGEGRVMERRGGRWRKKVGENMLRGGTGEEMAVMGKREKDGNKGKRRIEEGGRDGVKRE